MNVNQADMSIDNTGEAMNSTSEVIDG